MLYKQNNTESLSEDLFLNPTSEYRGTPFWAFNSKLDKEELCRQIEIFNKMGLGGFHMHARTGLDTAYLSDEFMDNIKACVNKAKEQKMLAWLYDEDRWPSGFAGGLLTKNHKYRARNLLFTPYKYGSFDEFRPTNDSSARSNRTENGYLLGIFDIVLNEDGTLKEYPAVEEDTVPKGTLWYAYVETPIENPWFNNQTYVNTLDKEAMDEFIKITYERYKEVVGDEFGKSIPAIFTDEPQFSHKSTLGYADDLTDITLPWTDELLKSFTQQYNRNLLRRIPELFWDLPDGEISQIRYFYHDHICELFTKAFADNCGKWCRENNIALTGHMMEEVSLTSQTAALGEAMRSYRGFDLPGVDILCDSMEYTTVKQAQSAVHQFGYEGVVSELYGVTNWDFDFRGHKFQGDWQAALGVSVRVHHLSWVSMAGEAKRDYPASINYQSPWHPYYSYVENHFARLNTALTRGKPIVKIGVIHPIESYWLHWGPKQSTAAIRQKMDDNFSNITKWLLFGCFDFNYISESLLPTLCESGNNPLTVGKMEYDVIIIPECETLRESTLTRLQEFKENGGKLIFMGDCPKYIDAVKNNRILPLYNESLKIPFNKNSLYTILQDDAQVQIYNNDATQTEDLIYNYRDDNDVNWLFITHGIKPNILDLTDSRKIKIKIKGCFTPKLYDTITGKIKEIYYEIKDNFTFITTEIYSLDSLLIQLDKDSCGSTMKKRIINKEIKQTIDFKQKVKYSREEMNVYMIDMAEYSLNNSEFKPQEEILRIDEDVRATLGYPSRTQVVAQPWVIEKLPIKNYVTLKAIINSEIAISNTYLALEDLVDAKIVLNNQEVNNKPVSYFTDKSIKTVLLPELKQGENILLVTLPFAEHRNIEWMYLLGDFNVKLEGTTKTIYEKSETIGFGNIVAQGMPFYGGNIDYTLEFTSTKEHSTAEIDVTLYKGSAVVVDLKNVNYTKEIDQNDTQIIAYSPYKVTINNLKEGKHTITLKLLGNRYNSFGAVHNCDNSWGWHGPNAWRTVDARWCYEYNLKPFGILKSPIITLK